MKNSNLLMIFLTLGCAVMILFVDISTPLGISEWVLYLLPLLFTPRIKVRYFPFVYTAICAAFMYIGFRFSPSGGVAPEFGLISRSLGLFVLTITSAILVRGKLAETAQAETEARFLSFMNNTSAIAWIKDEEFRHIYVNEAWLQMFKKSIEEIRGKTDFELWPEAIAKTLREHDLATIKNWKKLDITEVVPSPDGVNRVFLVQKFPFTDASGRKFIGGTATDITALKTTENALRDSERRFRSVWENSADAMRLTNAEGITVAVNAAYCKLAGATEKELVGAPFSTIYEGGKPMLDQYRERFAARTIETHLERKVQFRNGKIVFIEAANSFVELEHQQPLILSILRDLTERKANEEQQKTLERKLLDGQKLESLGVLAGGIAHDFNNLLTGVLGNAGLAILQVSEVSPSRPYLKNIEKLCLQAADLCKQMLAYSGRGQFAKQRINVNEVVREMTQLLQISISKKVVLKFNLASNLPPVDGDPSQIRQVIMNLIINASEAIEDKSGVITISTGMMCADRAYLTETYLAPDLREGEYVYVEVADTGSGMSPETKAKIFDPFFTTKFTGRGLGLAAVLGIVRGHKGALKVYSEVNKGTTFKFLLPATHRGLKTTEPEKLLPTPWKGSGTILVVDDEEHVRNVAQQMLTFFGFEVIVAVDGHDGVKKFQENSSRLTAVLLDLMMPGLNGEEVFREIRRIRPDTRVILTSGYNESSTTEHFVGKGLAGFLQKPFKAEDLQAKLQAALEGRLAEK